MAEILIGQYEGKSIISRIIKWRTWSKISHTAAIHGNETIEAWGGKVICQPFDQGHKPGTKVTIYSITCTDDQRQRFYNFMVSQVGMKYDYLGIVGFALRIKSQKAESWFCSELVFAALLYAGLLPLARIEPHKVSPGDLDISPLLKFHEERKIKSPAVVDKRG